MRIFRSRERAGHLLADRLIRDRVEVDALVAIPRGGIVVASSIAERYECPLIPAFVAKIRHPLNPEYAIGALDQNERVHLQAVHRNTLHADLLEEAIEEARQLLRARKREFSGIAPEVQLKGKTVVVVDEGVTTGVTCTAALRYARSYEPGRLILATPCASTSGARKVRPSCDEMISLVLPDPRFRDVAGFYDRFPEVSSEEVVRILKHARDAGRALGA